MRVFRREEVVSEITEADRVTHLECIAGKKGSARWGFALANGETSELEWFVSSSGSFGEMSVVCGKNSQHPIPNKIPTNYNQQSTES